MLFVENLLPLPKLLFFVINFFLSPFKYIPNQCNDLKF